MSLHALSLSQILGIWSDLDDAYHGKNGFGGDTAEIYIYRALPNCPLWNVADIDAETTTGRATREAADTANAALCELFRLFERERGVELWFGPREPSQKRRLGLWVAGARETHRVHVCVRQKQDAMRAKPMGYVIREGKYRGIGRYLAHDPRETATGSTGPVPSGLSSVWSVYRKDALVYTGCDPADGRRLALRIASWVDGHIVRRYGVKGGICT